MGNTCGEENGKCCKLSSVRKYRAEVTWSHHCISKREMFENNGLDEFWKGCIQNSAKEQHAQWRFQDPSDSPS